MKSISVGDLKRDFSEILNKVHSSGEKYIIEYGRKHKKVAMIIPYDEALVFKEKRNFGIAKAKGSFRIHDDFAITEEELLGY